MSSQVLAIGRRPTDASADLGPLTLQQSADFVRDGYVVIDTPLIGPAELRWCRETIMQLLDQGAGRREGRHLDLALRDGDPQGTLPSLLQPSMYARQLRRLSYRKTALAVARQLLGPEAEFAGDHAIYKPSYRGHPTPWHQDEAFREPGFEYEEISIWIALTDSTADNGAMTYIPASHRLGLLPHRLHGGGLQANTIECYSGFDQRRSVVCPVAAGAMIIHHGRTVHGALGSDRGASRLAYSLQYSTPVKLRRKIHDAPWLAQLRSVNRRQRKRFMLAGGVLLELARVLRSDRNSHRHYFAYFWRRRVNQLRIWWQKPASTR